MRRIAPPMIAMGLMILSAMVAQAQMGGFGGGTAPAAGAGSGASQAQRPGAQAAVRPSLETVGVIEPVERVYTTTVGGRLRPANTVSHPAPITGNVTAVMVVAGQAVDAGQTLFTITRDDASGQYAPVAVRARIAGIVSSVHARAANEIRSGENGVSVIDTSEYELTAQISDKDAFSVTVGQQITGAGANGGRAPGTLIARSPEPDYQTGLFALTFRFTGSDTVFPGQFITVDLPVETARGIFIAQNLLIRRYGRFFVWTVDEADTLRMREVTTGRTHESEIQILSGLTPGDRILLQRRGNEREGMPAPGTER